MPNVERIYEVTLLQSPEFLFSLIYWRYIANISSSLSLLCLNKVFALPAKKKEYYILFQKFVEHSVLEKYRDYEEFSDVNPE